MNLKLVLLMLSICCMAFSQTQTITYNTTSEEFANPERGIYHHTETHSNNYTLLNQSQLESWKNNDHSTLILRVFYLENFITSPITQDYLDKLDADFKTIRNAGIKCIVRFAYSNSTNGQYDATKNTILNHIAQLTPYLQEHTDVIAVMQAGFIGAWGEWYYTDHFGMPPNANDYANRKEIVDALLNALPNDRMVQLRTPKFKRTMYTTNALTTNEAYQSTNTSRLGHHNDCFLASSTDFGTYENTSIEYPYLETETNYTVMGGETCASNEPRSLCATALNEMEKFHWSYLNDDYHPTVVNKFDQDGCYDDIKKRLGYRFELSSGEFPTTASNAIPVTISMSNSGFAATYNPRNIFLVLRNTQTSEVFKLALTTDLRKIKGGITKVITESLALPATVYDGDYELLLHLPDANAAIENNPNYAIRLANSDLWEPTTGFNKLNATITIDKNVLATTNFEAHEYKIYPIPAKDKLILEFENITNYNLELYNLVGQRIHPKVLNSYQNKKEISTSNLPNGMYVLRVFNEHKKLTKKIIVNH